MSRNATTVIDDGVRVTYHATVLAGVHVNEQGMVGAMAVATKDVRPDHVTWHLREKRSRETERASDGQ
jgi:acetyltransferase-like isoleucine patch superfamily enzyme